MKRSIRRVFHLGVGSIIGLGLLLPLGQQAGAAPPRKVPTPTQQATAPATRDMRAAVLALLSGYEPGDPGDALRRLGPQVPSVLVAIAEDPATSAIRRLRAIEALGHVPTSAGLSYLQQLVRARRSATDSMSIFEVAAAGRALGGFGPLVSGELIALVDHPSADVREGVIAALSRLHTEEGDRILRARLSVERDPGTRAALVNALQRAEGR